jgi:hypothetical protein
MTGYVIVVSSGFASTIHGVWREEVAKLTADRWNRAFARKGLGLTATPQPIAGKSASARDRHATFLASMAEISAAEAAAHVDCVGCRDCDPDLDTRKVSS